MTVIDEIAAERLRQTEAEGWSAEHDDEHNRGELAAAAGCYALVSTWDSGAMFATVSRQPTQHGANFGWVSASTVFWPWAREWWKPTVPRRNLIKAAALLVAEIERIDRATAKVATENPSAAKSGI
jgi:hypothetical protein